MNTRNSIHFNYTVLPKTFTQAPKKTLVTGQIEIWKSSPIHVLWKIMGLDSRKENRKGKKKTATEKEEEETLAFRNNFNH